MLFAAKKMNGTGGQHIKLNKPDTDRQEQHVKTEKIKNKNKVSQPENKIVITRCWKRSREVGRRKENGRRIIAHDPYLI